MLDIVVFIAVIEDLKVIFFCIKLVIVSLFYCLRECNRCSYIIIVCY